MTTPSSNMHCDNPLCVDDECHGECEKVVVYKASEQEDNCCHQSCGCHDAPDDVSGED